MTETSKSAQLHDLVVWIAPLGRGGKREKTKTLKNSITSDILEYKNQTEFLGPLKSAQ